MNSDDNKDAKPTSSDDFSVNPPDDSKEKDESEQEGHNNKRNYKYSEDEMVGSPDQDEVPAKYMRIAAPPEENGETSRVEATNQDANITDASETGLRYSPSYEELLLSLLDLPEEVEAWKKEREEDARAMGREDGDYSDEEPEFLF